MRTENEMEVTSKAVGSDTPPVVKGQVQDDGAVSAGATMYTQSPLLSLAAAAAVAESEEE